MHKDLIVKQTDLNSADDAWDYLFVILEKYYNLWDNNPENIVKLLNDDQHSLLAYNTLSSQVSNGGFVQLIYNGYGSYIFESPLIEVLKKWGAIQTASVLEKVRPLYVAEVIADQEAGDDPLDEDDFSELFSVNAEFEEFEDELDSFDEADVIKKYVEDHLEDFIQVQ